MIPTDNLGNIHRHRHSGDELFSIGGAHVFQLAFFLWLFMEPLLSFLGASPALYEDCASYISALLPFFPAAALMMVFNALFIADGRPMQGFLVSLVSGLLNAGLDYLFMAELGWGIVGAALGTGLGETAAALIGIHYFSCRSLLIRFRKPVLEWRTLGQAMYNGSSELVTELSMGITTLLYEQRNSFIDLRLERSHKKYGRLSQAAVK